MTILCSSLAGKSWDHTGFLNMEVAILQGWKSKIRKMLYTSPHHLVIQSHPVKTVFNLCQSLTEAWINEETFHLSQCSLLISKDKIVGGSAWPRWWLSSPTSSSPSCSLGAMASLEGCTPPHLWAGLRGTPSLRTTPRRR